MAQTKVKLISDGVIVQGNLHSSHGITTAHIAEGTSSDSGLYYTNARADSRIAAASTSDLSEGTNLYYTDARADARVALIVDSSPATLNTLNELAAALGDDPNFAATTATSIGLKAPLASPSFTGNSTFAGSIEVGTGNSSIQGDLYFGANADIFKNSGNLTLDVAGHIILDADSGEIAFKDGGTTFLEIANSSSDAVIRSTVQDKDILFNGNDGGSAITALQLDMSNGGSATFRDDIDFGGKITQTGTGNNTFGGQLLVNGLSNYTGLTLTGSGGSRPAINFNNVNNGVLGSIFGTEGNAIIISTNGGNAVTIDSSQNSTFAGTISSNSISAQGMITVTQNDIGTGESVGLRIIRSGGAQVWNITSGQTGADNTTFNIRNSTNNTNVLGINASNNSATFAGEIRTANRLAIQETYFGYSSGYKVIQLGESAATKAISLGYNPNANTSGSFSGNEILIPNNIRLMAPAANNSGYYALMMLNSSNKVLLGSSNYLIESNYIMALDPATKNVGIGMLPSADAKLEILNGNFRIRGSSANVIQLSNTAGNTRAQLGNYGNEGDLSLYRSNNVKTVYISSYYDGYINNDTNKFGFGTTAPKTKLHVEGPTGTKNRSTTGGSSVYETTKYWGVNGNTTANISIDTPTVFPPMASGGFILVEVSASGYGNSGSNGLVFSYITGGYGGHYAAVNQPYHPVVITANSMHAGTCTWYNPDSTTIGITVTTTNSAGINGLMRVKVTTTY